MPAPTIVSVRPGGFDDWMRARGRLGGQHKVPRIDATGQLTGHLIAFLRAGGGISAELPPGAPT